MESWDSYPKIYAIGHRATRDLIGQQVIIEEKIDGSQFSFGRDHDGNLRIRSKGQEMQLDAPEKMFAKAAETVKEIGPRLQPGWTYRGEYLQKPKHNALAYDRVPERHIILFDVSTGNQEYLQASFKHGEALRIGLECVPVLWRGKLEQGDLGLLQKLLENTSILGGQKVEGVVIKPAGYDVFGMDKKLLLAKFVSEAFKEVHRKEWKKSNPTNSDILEMLAARYCSQARWQKAILHLRERGEIEDDPRDIGKLMQEVQRDVLEECGDEIKEALMKWAGPKVQRSAARGLPEWYKEQLAASVFAPAAESQP